MECPSTEDINPTDHSDPEDVADMANHSLVFKCIGSTKDQKYQRALQDARDLIYTKSQTVPVKLVHEDNNPYDTQALAFVCQIRGKHHTIGYVVSELLDEVHGAISNGSIVSVKFSWIKYITDWTKSGPGFFAGIEIVKKGTLVKKCYQVFQYKVK